MHHVSWRHRAVVQTPGVAGAGVGVALGLLLNASLQLVQISTPAVCIGHAQHAILLAPDGCKHLDGAAAVAAAATHASTAVAAAAGCISVRATCEDPWLRGAAAMMRAAPGLWRRTPVAVVRPSRAGSDACAADVAAAGAAVAARRWDAGRRDCQGWTRHTAAAAHAAVAAVKCCCCGRIPLPEEGVGAAVCQEVGQQRQQHGAQRWAAALQQPKQGIHAVGCQQLGPRTRAAEAATPHAVERRQAGRIGVALQDAAAGARGQAAAVMRTQVTGRVEAPTL